MNMVYRSLDYLKHWYSQVNPATLTGAIDILVVERPDGTLVASPFHVRFGKLGVIRAKEKRVNIAINDEKIKNLHMKLGDQGEAFFLEEFDEEEAIPLRLMTSPLPSRPSTPTDEQQPDVFDSDLRDAMQSVGESGKRKKRKKRKRRSIIAASNSILLDDSKAGSGSESDDDVIVCNTTSPPPSHQPLDVTRSMSLNSNDSYQLAQTCVPKLSITKSPSDGSDQSATLSDSWSSDVEGAEFTTMRCAQSDSELPMRDNSSSAGIMVPPSPFSDSEANDPRMRTGVMWGWGQLPARNEGQDSSSSDEHIDLKEEVDGAFDNSHFRTVSVTGVDSVTVENEVKEINKKSRNTSTNSVQSHPTRQRKDTEGLYLDDVLSLDPSQANLYLQQQPNPIPINRSHQQVDGYDRALSPGGSDIDSGTDCQNQDDNSDGIEDLADVTISLCGFGSASTTVDSAKFAEKQISYETFIRDPLPIINDPNLVVRLGESRYLTWQNAAPVIMSLAVFRRPLTSDCLERIVQPTQPSSQPQSRIMGWLWRRQSKTDSAHGQDTNSPLNSPSKGAEAHPKHLPVNKSFSAAPSSGRCSTPLSVRDRRQTEGDANTEAEVAEIMEPELKRSQSAREIVYPQSDSQLLSVKSSTSTHCGGKVMRKTTRLCSDKLKALQLEEGANTITFSVTTKYQGTTRCSANVFLWKWSDKIVVSDIDGTITKSDVFGQILPVVGKDWTQGGVAQLYQNISKNGYKFIYVSSRAIGQASMTKGYLNWINQQGVSLPPGPLLLSPTSLMTAFHREVIEKKPEKFKIECLKDIKTLFPENPFVAGFGNKTNDVSAYTAVGMPTNRMFTINHKGELKHETLPTYTSSYSGLGELVDNYFPSLHKEQDFAEAHDYSDFTYWRENVTSFEEDFDLFNLA